MVKFGWIKQTEINDKDWKVDVWWIERIWWNGADDLSLTQLVNV